MRAVITARLVEQLRRAAPRAVEVWDTRQPGLVLRLRPSGHASYGVRYGRTRRLTLGPAGVLTPEQARALARAVLGDVARGTDPAAERRRRRAGTL
ncbi:MAG TPA: Arm DNA-binding domain-containing protein, partial [Vicinamibacterales bacterium]|nr:Arm DNA-binding domain-containing protein [Vicinamibacterales bacterium]